MKSLSTAAASLLAATMLAACGGGNVSSSTGPRAESSRTISTQGLPVRDSAAGTDNPGPHGPEIDSGAVFTVTDGNVHMAYAAGATMTRTGDGVLVVSHGHARKFSAAAVVMQTGAYHVYAPVAH
ncbi:MAG: hypothetical protein M3N49_09700 [Candidatus Eremiobacteraeota bacterium]|nr:hypothetical protein [Candidatus Eremiobacteraeota bacterium]